MQATRLGLGNKQIELAKYTAVRPARYSSVLLPCLRAGMLAGMLTMQEAGKTHNKLHSCTADLMLHNKLLDLVQFTKMHKQGHVLHLVSKEHSKPHSFSGRCDEYFTVLNNVMQAASAGMLP